MLIPRPETELIVEAVLELFPDRDAPLAIADVCTGSGCVAVAIAHERPRRDVVATDISRGGAGGRAAERGSVTAWPTASVSRRGDLLDGLDRRPFDAIVANPPYVVGPGPAGAAAGGARLRAGASRCSAAADGLDLVTRLVAEAPGSLRPGGYLIFEFGLGQDVRDRGVHRRRATELRAASSSGAICRASPRTAIARARL